MCRITDEIAEEARKEGREEGREEGRAEGREEEQRKHAKIQADEIRTMHSMKMAIDDIAKIKNLPVEKIEEILRKTE